MTSFELTPEALRPGTEKMVFVSVLEELRYTMNQRLMYYQDRTHSYDSETSLTAEALEEAGITLYDLNQDEIAELDELELEFKQLLKEDDPVNDEKEEIQ